MLIKLIRNKPQGNAIFGQLSVDDSALSMDTLEHSQYAIPAGFYRLRMTYSPRFKEILPILDGVIGYRQSKVECQKSQVKEYSRAESPDSQHSTLDTQPHSGLRTGIRIHAGNTIAHTIGCILVGEADETNNRLLSSRKALNRLRDYLLNYQNQHPHEEIYIEISEPEPYPLYTTPYTSELQEP